MQVYNHLLPSTVTDDSVLRNYFKPGSFPHYVWINQDREIVAITEPKDVNETSIAKIISGQEAKMAVKNDYYPYHLGYLPDGAFIPGVQRLYKDSVVYKKLERQDLVFRSVLTRWVDGLVLGVRKSYDDSSMITVRNMDILHMYVAAFPIFPTAKPIVEIPDSNLYRHITGRNPDGSRFFSPGSEALSWLKENAYSYEIQVPKELRPQWHEIMLQDINRYFGAKYGIVGGMEKRPSKYLALLLDSAAGGLASKGGEFKTKTDAFSLMLQNSPIGNLKLALTFPLQNYPPIEDETGYKGKIDIELHCKLSDLKAVNKELARYGLQLVEKQALRDVIVIKMK